MYSHVLIPVTFGEDCDIEQSVKLANALTVDGARVTFLHIIEPLPTYLEPHIPAGLTERSLESAQERLDQVSQKIPGATGVIAHGSAGRGISDWARDNSVDCIVISSHRPVLSDYFLGSTAAWVVRHAQCAVHVLR